MGCGGKAGGGRRRGSVIGMSNELKNSLREKEKKKKIKYTIRKKKQRKRSSLTQLY